MGTLSDAVEAEMAGARGLTCTVGAFLSTLDDATADEVRGLVDRHELHATAVCRVLNDNLSCTVKAATLLRHRRGECTCG